MHDRAVITTEFGRISKERKKLKNKQNDRNLEVKVVAVGSKNCYQ